jgi:hypothetical protein
MARDSCSQIPAVGADIESLLKPAIDKVQSLTNVINRAIL